MRRPSKRKRREDTGTPTRSLYLFFNFPICVVCLTLKWISLESWPTTFSLMYSLLSSPILKCYFKFGLYVETEADRQTV